MTQPSVSTTTTDRGFFGHPRGLGLLFAVEMWERCVNVAPDAATKSQIKEHLMGLL